MTEAINLYLLRELLILPCRNTIYEYFEKIGLACSLDECKRTVHTVFDSLNEGQKTRFISFHEIHIKPGLHYQGKYILGNALNNDSQVPAKFNASVYD